MKPGSLIVVPPRSYVNFYPDLHYGNSERITENQSMLVLPGYSDGTWVKVLLSDQRVGYICAIGMKAVQQ
jgi:hypothetical protein